MGGRFRACSLFLLCAVVALAVVPSTGCKLTLGPDVFRNRGECDHDQSPRTPTHRRPIGSMETDDKSAALHYGPCAPHNPNQVMTGISRCSRCGQAMLGNQVHTVWLNDETPASVMCSKCDKHASAAEKGQLYGAWLRSQPPEDQQRLGVQLKQALSAVPER